MVSGKKEKGSLHQFWKHCKDEGYETIIIILKFIVLHIQWENEATRYDSAKEQEIYTNIFDLQINWPSSVECRKLGSMDSLISINNLRFAESPDGFVNNPGNHPKHWVIRN